MSYRGHLGPQALIQLNGFPEDARNALAAALGRYVMENPYDPLTTEPTTDPQVRRVLFDAGLGMATFEIDDARETVTVVNITWVG